MTELDLDAIKARADAATDPPWTPFDDGLVWPDRAGDPVCGASDHADRVFIAHARTDIPALLAEVERLRAAVERVRKLADNLDTESPKPGPGGFIAEGIRDALDGAS